MLDTQPANQPSRSPSGDQLEWSQISGPEKPLALAQGKMLEALESVERALPLLLADPDAWRTLDVTYHPPRVERVFLQHGELRVSLHCIHACERSEALFHPHPWPSAMRILSGSYEMAVGHGSGRDAPPIAATMITGPGTSYEMTEPDAWHYVRPVGGAVYTLMVTGKPWPRETPKSSEPLTELSPERKREIMEIFAKAYSQ